MSAVAHFFMSVGGSKIHERLAHFFIDIYMILSSISASGAKPELSIAFTVKEPSKVSRTLLENASLNAKEKADVLCHCLGVKLGELLSIDYNWGELNILSRTRYEIADEMMPLMAASECSVPEIEPDDIDVRDTATFVWEIN